MIKKITSEISDLYITGPAGYNEIIPLLRLAFHELIEEKNISVFPQIMSHDLKIYKYNEVWDYQLTYRYIQQLISEYKKIEFLPLEMLLLNGIYVTLKFTETLHKFDGTVTKHKFISIFDIESNRIRNIWELSVEGNPL